VALHCPVHTFSKRIGVIYRGRDAPTS